MSTDKQRELKYQSIRLYNSNQISLNDIKALFRIVTTVADDEYTSKTDQKGILGTRDRLDKITKLSRTRNAAVQEAVLKFKIKPKLSNTRAEEIAKFTTGYKGGIPANFARYGILRSKTNRINKPRHGSSKGKIKRPTIRGFDRFNKDFDQLQKDLLGLLRKGSRKELSQNLKKVRDSVSVRATRK